MVRHPINISVLGAGVSGLSTAILLAEEGFKVKVISYKSGRATTSSAAAAFWYPFWVGETPDHSWYKPEWAWDTFKRMEPFIDNPNSGITRARLVEYFPVTMSPEAIDVVIDSMWWRHFANLNFEIFDVPNSSPLALSNYHPIWRFKSGIKFDTLVMNMSIYLPYLNELARNAGITFEERFVSSDNLDATVAETDFVVNCTSLGSRELISDQEIMPVEGVVLRLPSHPDVKEVVLVHNGTLFCDVPLYIVPRGGSQQDIILGGTLGKDKKGDPRHLEWPVTCPNEDIVSEQAKGILRSCSRMIPSLQNIDPIEVTVGYRPSRPQGGVRLEPDWQNSFQGRLIHNYGHGGGGVTLSWGCALQVVNWIKRLLEGQGRGY